MAGNIKSISKLTLPFLNNYSSKNSLAVIKNVAAFPLRITSVCKNLDYNATLAIKTIDQRKSTYYAKSKLLLHYSLNVYNGNRNLMSNRKSPKKPKKKRVPRLILLQNPFTWLMTKFDFMVLRHVWDSTFVEHEFKFGTKQAVSRVTQVISANHLADLNGLLTKPARLSLLRELDRNWSEKQRTLLALHRDDIQISSARKVYFIRIADKKYCDVDMSFLALKWIPISTFNALLFTEIFARFHREYTPHSIPEWTIAFFKITRFEIIKKEDRELS